MQQSLFTTFNPKQQSGPLAFKDRLNRAQYEAVVHEDGPVLVIAGAGSGKTRTLVYRTAYLVNKGISPERILLLTFTRKASQEMLSRASMILDDTCRMVMGGTFHAVAGQLLRRYGHLLGYKPNFTIIDQADAEGIVNLLKSSLNFSGIGKKFPSKRLIVTAMSRSVNKAVSFSELIADRYWHLQEFTEELLTIKEHYQKFKFEHGLMDYDDLLVNWKRVMEEDDTAKQEIAGRFQHVMVDEYQDTNHIQADIVRLVGECHKNVMVVGDDSQSIYSFRGADFKNIMDFPRLFPGTKIIRLEENYRSTQPILAMTNAIIENAAEKYSKKLFSSIDGRDKPTIFGARNETDQANFIVRKILSYKEEGESLNEIAVLFRSGYHSYKLELELANHHLPFEKRGGIKLTESAHIKDVLSHLRVVSNKHDFLSWNRILLLIDKVGPKTAQKILEALKENEEPLDVLRTYPAAKAWNQGFRELLAMLGGLTKEPLSPLEQFELVMEYYQPIFESIYHDDYPTRARDLEQLRTILAGYSDLQAFIDDTALDPPGNEREAGGFLADDNEKLILSTVHSAKGLEWKTVFIINLAEGKFPSAMARLPEELEEERRLLYVAATRAKKRLYLIYPREVLSPQKYTEPAIISRYLEEIPFELTQTQGLDASSHAFASAYTNGNTGRAKRVDPGEVRVGTRIRHSFFGEGKVEKIVGPRTVELFFPRHGLKTINLDYAKVEVLS
jgi:DNA helicase-2/ATP-dependent DNA helicase PcrA